MKLKYPRFQRGILTFVIYILLSVASICTIFCFFFTFQITKNNSQKNNYCDFIKNVSVNGSRIHIDFIGKIDVNIINVLQQRIYYETQAFNQLLIIKPKLIKIVSYNENSLVFEYDYPFVQYYQGHLLCFNSDFDYQYDKKPVSIKHLSDKVYPISINISSFQKDTKYSQMQCYGGSIQKRYCRVKKFIRYNEMFFFFSHIAYQFPSPFMSMSSWPIPNDIIEQRLEGQPIVIDANPLTRSDKNIKELSYYFARAVNLGMLWHTLFETIAPLYQTIVQIEGDVIGKNRRIFYNDMYVKEVYYSFYTPFTRYDIVHMGTTPINVMFDDVVIGLRKFNTNHTLFRDKSTSFNYQYDKNDLIMPKFRDFILESLRLYKGPPSIEHPHVLVPLRRSKSRSIVNFNEIIESMERICPFCEFTYANLDAFSIEDQVRFISNMTVIFGVHGSALAHTIWMHPSNADFTSYLVEVFPPNYWCRQWYKSVAESVNVKHYGIYGDIADKNKESDFCYSHHDLCPIPQCHDFLRDQILYLPKERFEKVWENITKQLKQRIEESKKKP